MRVTGRIDRVDVGQVDGRTVFSVIDYKTGRSPSLKEEQIASGERLQLPIYVAAAQALFFNDEATPVAAGYWTMDRGFDRAARSRCFANRPPTAMISGQSLKHKYSSGWRLLFATFATAIFPSTAATNTARGGASSAPSAGLRKCGP